MNNFIIISRTYTETTPESCEIGDFSDTGFITEREEITFKELVELLKLHYWASQSPNTGNTDICYSTNGYIKCYRTRTERVDSIHFHHDNTANAAKYWKLAAKIAGLIAPY